MKKRATRWMCMALSAVMCFSSTCMTAFAEEAEEAVETSPMINFDKSFIELESSETSVKTELTLNSTSEIEGTIEAQDITLSGAFKDMTVGSISNDEETISLTLAGVPDLTREYQGLQPVGTLEISGSYFGTEEPLEASVTILPQVETDEHAAPCFWPYFDAMIDNKDTFEMHITLLPASGEFTEEFSEYDISFDMDMKKAKITSFKKSDAYCELIASIPKYKLSEGEETYSYMGSVILSEGSMVNAAGEVNEEEMSVTREFSPETTGRDNLSMADINTIKGIVGGFGNTAWGTIGGVMSGGSSAFSAAWTVLGFCGVVPTDRSRHSEVMNKLDEIHKSVKEVDENVKYCQRLLLDHSKMLRTMGVKIDTYYVAGFNTQMTGMISTMNKIEAALQNKQNLPLIEAAVEEVCAQYQIPTEGSDRDMDFDELGDGSLGDGSYVEDMFGDEAAPAPVPEEYYDNTETTPAADTVDTAEAVAEDLADDLLSSGTKEGEDLTGEPEEPEPLWTDRVLDDDEMLALQWALDEKLQAIHQSPGTTIGELVKSLEKQYSEHVIGYFETDGDANPIKAYINLHAQKDNFSTTSLAEKVLYAEEIKYQLARAVTLLQVLDGASSHTEEEDRFRRAFFPDPAEGAVNLAGDPWCYVMDSYVELSAGEITAIYRPMKRTKKNDTPVRINILDNAQVIDFVERMNDRTCAEELDKAGFTADQMYVETRFDYEGLQHYYSKDTLDGKNWFTTKYDSVNRPHAGLTFEYELVSTDYGTMKFKNYWDGEPKCDKGVWYWTPDIVKNLQYLGTYGYSIPSEAGKIVNNDYYRYYFSPNAIPVAINKSWPAKGTFAIVSKGLGWNDKGIGGYSIDVTNVYFADNHWVATQSAQGWAPIYPKHFLRKVDYAGNIIDYSTYFKYLDK